MEHIAFWILIGSAPPIILGLLRSRKRPRGDEHPAREQLLELVRKRPGITLEELLKASEANRGTLSYHLERLQQDRLVAKIRSGRNSHYFVSEEWPDESVPVSVLSRGRCLEVATAIAESPGIVQKELAQRLHVSRKVFRGYVRLLSQQGLLQEDRVSKNRRYFATEKLTTLLPRLRWRKERVPSDPERFEEEPREQNLGP